MRSAARSSTALSYRQWYRTPRWKQERKDFLSTHHFCAMCAQAGRETRATVIDHKRPHKGDAKLFWSHANWQAVCQPCHDGAKQSEERLGYSKAIGEDGWPTDEAHPFNRMTKGYK